MSILQSLSRWNRIRLERRKQAKLDRRTPPYSVWIKRFDTLTPQQAAEVRAKWHERGPLISIIVPTYNPQIAHLEAAIASVQRQLYSRWELCIADDASTAPGVRELLQSFAERDPRIQYVFREQNGHISAASNSALALAKGEFIALLDQDDVLADHALVAIAHAIEAHPQVGLIYSDEDKIDEQGRRFSPHFKPDWNAFLLRSQNYICHLVVIRRSLVMAVGGFRLGLEGSQDHDLLLRCTEQLQPHDILHIPHVLYHWRVHDGSTARKLGSKPYAQINGCQAIQDHLGRQGVNGSVEMDGLFYRVRYRPSQHAPRVSIILLTRDRPELLRSCVRSVLDKTDYDNLEIIIVDNGTAQLEALALLSEMAQDRRVRLLRDTSPFNYSALNNRAAMQANGEYLCLMNNDIEVLDKDWLLEMVSVAQQPSVGAVGARLYYPNGKLQHAGVILGPGGIACHPFRLQSKDDGHYMSRSQLMQNLTAVTAACMLTPTTLYRSLGGLDEAHLAVAYNDIDYCLRIREAGHTVVYDPYAEFVHHESVSRGREDTPDKKARFRGEQEYMRARWGKWLARDQAYNPNLSFASDNFAIADRPRTQLTDWL
jgi:GT2 family glycosyltransferase